MSDATEGTESPRCANPDCRQPIADDETPVYADDGVYHMGCDIVEVHNEVGSGGFGRAE